MFSGRRIRQARELRRLTQSEIAKKVGVWQSAIAHVENGYKNPSRDLMTKIAVQTKFPISFFASDPPKEFPAQSLLFRARASLSKKDAAEACRWAELLNEITEKMARHVTVVPLELPSPISDPIVAARHMRVALHLAPDEPIPNLTNSVERAGVLIFALPATLVGRDAFTLWIDEQSAPQPVIAVSRDRPGDRLRLSLAHELGHVVMRHSPRVDPDQERRAYTFAAELLLPEAAMRREINSPITLSSIAILKARWKVSIQALIRRAYDLHLLVERQYRYLFEQLSAKGWRTSEPINLGIPPEKPRGLRQMVELVYGNPIDYERMAADLHLSTLLLQEAMQEYAESSITEEKRDGSSGRVISFTKPK